MGKTTEEPGKASVTFACRHVRLFPEPYPKMGDVMWCPQCSREVSVINAPAYWRVRCETCMFSRATGAVKIDAEIKAAKHRMSFPTHVVRLYDGNVHRLSYGNRDSIVTRMMRERDLKTRRSA